MGFFADYLEEYKRKLKEAQGFFKPQTGKLATWGRETFFPNTPRLDPSKKLIGSGVNILSPAAGREVMSPTGSLTYLQSRIKNPVARTGLNYARNLINTSTKGSESFGKSYQHLIDRNYAQSAGNLAKGVGQWGSLIIPGAKKIHSFANLISSIDKPIGQSDLLRRGAAGVLKGQTGIENIAANVPDRYTETPFGNIDLAKTAGSMYGFVNNPVNKAFFKLTNKFIPTKNKTILKWLGTTALRGSFEDILLGFADMPTNLNDTEKASYMADRAFMGAVTEIGGQLISGGSEKILGSKPVKWTVKEAATLFDSIKEGSRKWNIPVTEPNANGKLVTMPMWRKFITTSQPGFIGVDKPKGVKSVKDIIGDKKPGDFVKSDLKTKKDVTARYMAERHGFDEIFTKKLQKNYTDIEINRAMGYVKDSGKPVGNAEGYVVDALKTKIYTREPVKPGRGTRTEPTLSPEEVFRANQNAKEYKTKTPEAKQPKTVKSKIEHKVVETSGSRITDFRSQMPKDVLTLKADEANGSFQFGNDYGKAWIDDLRVRASDAGLDPVKFGQMARGEIPITPQARKIHNEYLQASRAILSYSGAKTQLRQDWGMPLIWENSLKMQEFLPNTFIDEMNSEFGNILPRIKNEGGYIKDPFKSLEHYWERALVHKFRPIIEAKRRGIPVEAVVKEMNLAKEMGQSAIDGKLKDLNLIDRIKEIAKESGKKIDTNTVKGKLKTAESGLYDSWRNLKELGVYKAFEPLDNARIYANSLLEDTIKPLLKAGRFNEAALALSKHNPDINPEAVGKWLSNRGRAGINPENLLNSMTQRAFKNKGVEILTKFLEESKFDNLHTQAYVNDAAKLLLSRDIVSKTMLKDILRFTRGAWYHGALGLNFRSAINNLFEPKRLWALTDTKTIGAAYKKALSGGDEILEKYDITRKVLEDELDVRFGKGTSQKLLEKGSNTIMYMFNKSEALKDKVFLHAFEMKADELKLDGFKKTKYVVDNFQKYAHKYGKLGTVGLFKNDVVKTILQFNQYGIKDIGLTVDMARQTGGVKTLLKGDLTPKQKEGWNYLLKMGMANFAITAVVGALYGARFEEVWGNLPTEWEDTSPTAKLINSVWNAGKELKEQADAGEDLDWDRIMSGKLKRQLTTLIPAGNQVINKTGGFIGDLKRGYSETAGGNVRYPTPTGLGRKAIGLMMGGYSTPEAQRYYKENLRSLGTNQSQDYRDLQGINPQAARDEYERILQNRQTAKQEKISDEKLIDAIMSGKPVSGQVSSPKDNNFDDWYAKIAGEHGLDPNPDDPKHFYDYRSAYKAGVRNTDASGHFPSEYKLTGHPTYNLKDQPKTIYDIIAKSKSENDTRSLIEDVLVDDDGKFTEMADEQKSQYLQMKGVTEADIKDYELYKFKNATVKDRADLIIQQGDPDFTALYKAQVVSLEVLKELQRRGFISDASALWEKLKMTDVYYRQEAIKEADLTYQKGMLKSKADTQKKLLKARVTGVSEILKSASYTHKKVKWSSYKPMTKMNLPTPTPYKIKKVTTSF